MFSYQITSSFCHTNLSKEIKILYLRYFNHLLQFIHLNLLIQIWNFTTWIVFRMYCGIIVSYPSGGRSATIISRPSHILHIFSSEPPRDARPSHWYRCFFCIAHCILIILIFFNKSKICLRKFSTLILP